jgi:hypothetical protein
MPLKRVLTIALGAALLLRVLPIVLPWIWPSYRASVERLRFRADIATAAVMLALVVSMLVRREPAYAGLVAVLSIPAFYGAIRAVRERLRS